MSSSAPAAPAAAVYTTSADQVAESLPSSPAHGKSWPARLIRSLTWHRKSAKQDEKQSIALPTPQPERVQASLAEKDFNTSSSLPPTVFYLAYGSNLCYETFQGRRGIRPLSAVNVAVPELKLVFDLPGVPYFEPCFANSARRGGQTAAAGISNGHASSEESSLLANSIVQDLALIGVVYEVTRNDYHRIIATEGPAYADVVVQCHILKSQQSELATDESTPDLYAHTLLAPLSNSRSSGGSRPAQASLRYLTLCRNGAAEHNLPAEWQAHLSTLQHYHTTSIRQTLGKLLFAAVWGPPLLLAVAVRRLLGGIDGNRSSIVTGFTTRVFNVMWLSYDYVFKHVFGDGERTEI